MKKRFYHSNWTETAYALLAQMWLQGKSNKEIAIHLNEKCYLKVSAEFISQKAKELGLPPKLQIVDSNYQPKPIDVTVNNITFSDKALDHNTCRWPFKEGDPYISCCAEPKAKNSIYCEKHKKMLSEQNRMKARVA